MSYINVIMYLMSIPRPEKKGKEKIVDMRGNPEATNKFFKQVGKGFK